MFLAKKNVNVTISLGPSRLLIRTVIKAQVVFVSLWAWGNALQINDPNQRN